MNDAMTPLLFKRLRVLTGVDLESQEEQAEIRGKLISEWLAATDWLLSCESAKVRMFLQATRPDVLVALVEEKVAATALTAARNEETAGLFRRIGELEEGLSDALKLAASGATSPCVGCAELGKELERVWAKWKEDSQRFADEWIELAETNRRLGALADKRTVELGKLEEELKRRQV